MESSINIIRAYETAIRDLVTSKNFKSNKSVKEKQKLNKEEDWAFICGSLDVIGDTTLAMRNFLEFKLEGNNDAHDFGEKYLRLYGVLNATYLQQLAIVTLYKRSNISKYQYVIDQFAKLEICQIRHKLGAHSTEYKVNEDQLETYSINRISAEGYKLEFLDGSLKREWIDLEKLIEDHLLIAIKYLDIIYEKLINKLYRGKDNKPKEHVNRLKELRLLTKKS